MQVDGGGLPASGARGGGLTSPGFVRDTTGPGGPLFPIRRRPAPEDRARRRAPLRARRSRPGPLGGRTRLFLLLPVLALLLGALGPFAAAPAQAQNNPPMLTVGAFSPTAVATAKTATVTVRDADTTDSLSAEYKVLADPTCNATTYRAGRGTAITLSATADTSDGNTHEGTVTLTRQPDNNKYVCVKAGDGTASVYGRSARIAGIDRFGPGIETGVTAPIVGTAYRITLTEHPSKVAKYAVIEVDGSATSSSVCDDPSASGDNFSTTTVNPPAKLHVAPSHPGDRRQKALRLCRGRVGQLEKPGASDPHHSQRPVVHGRLRLAPLPRAGGRARDGHGQPDAGARGRRFGDYPGNRERRRLQELHSHEA